MNDLYIGLMSGTSVDGIDAVIVDFEQSKPVLIGTLYIPYHENIREKIFALCEKGDDEIERLGELDVLLGKAFAETVNILLKQNQISPQRIRAIGSHGQTIRHRPAAQTSFTLQIGDPNIIAAETHITTVADFRRKDMAQGGQGAPLVPAFHHYAFAPESHARAVVNIGGIANITLLNDDINHTQGFDTGPGNTLLDAWIHFHLQKKYDQDGEWAAEGKIHPVLLQSLLNDTYFKLPAPKSTGREYFNLAWLEKYLSSYSRMQPVDIQRTLLELTARSILQAIPPNIHEILICGGGVKNKFLLSRLQALASPNISVTSTATLGLHPDWIEAMAFAWLARQTLQQLPGNIPAVTGAKKAVILGGVYFS